MKITIHQPEHMPWLGFFHKINMADLYVVLDNVQYRRRYFQNRNKVRTRDGWQWVTVPLQKEDRDELLIKNAMISKDEAGWKDENLKRIYHSYCKAPYFKSYWDAFKNVYSRDYSRLEEMNMALISLLMTKFGINKKILFSSEMDVGGEKGDLILDICKKLKAATYISGISGKEYLDSKKFAEAGIEVIFQEFHHPIYKQLYEPFIPCISSVDLLFNYGDKSLDIINGLGIPVMENLFA